jgi:hypothetical protein
MQIVERLRYYKKLRDELSLEGVISSAAMDLEPLHQAILDLTDLRPGWTMSGRKLTHQELLRIDREIRSLLSENAVLREWVRLAQQRNALGAGSHQIALRSMKVASDAASGCQDRLLEVAGGAVQTATSGVSSQGEQVRP